jgi:hypothetical protein
LPLGSSGQENRTLDVFQPSEPTTLPVQGGKT